MWAPHLQPSRVSVDLPTMRHRQIPFEQVGPKGALQEHTLEKTQITNLDWKPKGFNGRGDLFLQVKGAPSAQLAKLGDAILEGHGNRKQETDPDVCTTLHARGGGKGLWTSRNTPLLRYSGGVLPPATMDKTRPLQASEKLLRFSPMCKEHAGSCCFHFYYPPTGQSGDYCRWKRIAFSFYFTRASFRYIMLARLEQCRTAAMGNMSPAAATKPVTAVLWHVCSSRSSHCSSQYELL